MFKYLGNPLVHVRTECIKNYKKSSYFRFYGSPGWGLGVRLTSPCKKKFVENILRNKNLIRD